MQSGCVECGYYPANHTLTWLSMTADVLIGSARLPLARSFFVSKSMHVGKSILTKAWPLVSRVCVGLRIISYRADIEGVVTPRSRVMWEEAKQRGLNVRQLFFFGIPTELFEFRLTDDRRYVFQSLPIPPQYAQKNVWADDKHKLAEELLRAGIAAPRSVSVSNIKQAREALREFGRVCIKPRRGSQGRHTFPYVSTEEELEYAFNSAQKVCRFVVVEEHLEGDLVRATCVNGILVGFLECNSPRVVGDGVSTIGQLIEKENETKPEHVYPITMTPIHEKYIARRGYTVQSVLEAGKKLPLAYWAGFMTGGRNWEYGTNINTELKLEIERAARLTGLPVVGFDLIIENAHKGPREQKWGIIEANSIPWIDLHQRPSQNIQINVAARIWDLWDEPKTEKILATS